MNKFIRFKKPFFYLTTLYFILLLIDQLSAFAYEIENAKNKVKIGQLPEFCLCAGYPPPSCSEANRSRYIQHYGNIFNHIHHYCWGLDKLNIQLQSGKPSDAALESVISEFDYVLKLKDPKQSMHAEIWTKKGQVLLMLNKNMEAVNSFYNAIKSNKRYIPAYIYLSQYLKSKGDNSSACKILKYGIENNPKSQKLKQLAATCKSQ